MALPIKQQIINNVADALKKVKDVKIVYIEGEAPGEKKKLHPCIYLEEIGDRIDDPEKQTYGTRASILDLRIIFMITQAPNPMAQLTKYEAYTKEELYEDVSFGLCNNVMYFEIGDVIKGLGKDIFEEGARGIDPNFPIFVMNLTIYYLEMI